MPESPHRKSHLWVQAVETLKALSAQPRVFTQAAAALVILVLALPFAVFLFNLFRQGGEFSLDAFRDALFSHTSYYLVKETLILALGSALFAMLAGLPLGFLFCATRFPLRRLFLAALVLPLCLPSFLWALGWEMILGRQGYLGELLWEGSSDWTSGFLFSAPGAVFVFGLYFSGLAVLSVFVFLRFRVGGFAVRPEETWRTNFLRFLAAYAKSFVPWLTLFLIALAMTREFAAASLLGRETLTVEIFSFFSTFYNYDSIAAPGIIAIVFALVFWAVWEWVFRRRAASLAEARESAVSHLLQLSKWQAPIFWILIFVVTAFYFFPLWIFFVSSQGVEFYWQALREGWGSILRSVVFSLLGSAFLLFCVFVIEQALKFTKALWSAAVEKSFALLFFIPGILTGVIINRFWHTRWTAWIYTSAAIILLGIATQYVYPMFLAKRFFPNARIWGLAAAGFFISLREMASTVLLSPTGEETLLVRIFTLKPVETEPVLSALSVIFLILIAVPVGILAIKFRRRSP